MSNLHLNIAIECFPPQIVVFNDVSGEQLEGHLYRSRGISRYMFFISAPPNFTPGVLMTMSLFHIIFAETMLAARVVRSYG